MEWNVEELKLLNEKNRIYLGKEKIYNCESEVTREEKISFVDSFQDGKLSYLLELINKFNEDEKKLPKDNWGDVKTVSLKAWLNKNDTKYERKIIDNRFRIGQYNLLSIERNIKYEYKGTYETYEDIVDELFHRQLQICEREEKIWFLEHDEYSILKEKFRNKKYNTTFDVHIGECSDGSIYVYDEDGNNKRNITIDELKELLAKYEELDKLVEKLIAETNIKY